MVWSKFTIYLNFLFNYSKKLWCVKISTPPLKKLPPLQRVSPPWKQTKPQSPLQATFSKIANPPLRLGGGACYAIRTPTHPGWLNILIFIFYLGTQPLLGVQTICGGHMVTLLLSPAPPSPPSLWMTQHSWAGDISILAVRWSGRGMGTTDIPLSEASSPTCHT